MPFFKALTALSSSGPIASRAFMPLFIASLLASERVHSLLRKIDVFADDLCLNVPSNMAWLGSDGFIITVGILALLEVFADKNDDIKELMEPVQIYVKTGASILVTLAILPPSAVEAISTGPLAVEQAGFGDLIGWRGLVIVGTGVMTFFLAKFRASFFGHWFEVDDEDDFNIRKIISFMEDLWALIALPFFLVFPILAGFIVVMLFGFILASRKLVNWLEDRRRAPCAACNHDVLPTASACPECKAEVTPKEVLSWNLLFGRRVPVVGDDLEEDVYNRHRLRLLSRRRCPSCAERVVPATFAMSGCGQCGFSFSAAGCNDWFENYRTEVIGRGLRLVLPLMLLSWIPAVGIALAIVAVKVFISAPLRMFLGGFSKFGLKWGLRVFTVILLIFGSLPFVSLVAVPLLMLVHIWIYSRFAKKRMADGDVEALLDASGNASRIQGL
ncbi:hypothetical protein BVX99_02920 [bacterium F16]|nr:hypothetical protein BVX99_02920 [bacterium F16]